MWWKGQRSRSQPDQNMVKSQGRSWTKTWSKVKVVAGPIGKMQRHTPRQCCVNFSVVCFTSVQKLVTFPLVNLVIWVWLLLRENKSVIDYWRQTAASWGLLLTTSLLKSRVRKLSCEKFVIAAVEFVHNSTQCTCEQFHQVDANNYIKLTVKQPKKPTVYRRFGFITTGTHVGSLHQDWLLVLVVSM